MISETETHLVGKIASQWQEELKKESVYGISSGSILVYWAYFHACLSTCNMINATLYKENLLNVGTKKNENLDRIKKEEIFSVS